MKVKDNTVRIQGITPELLFGLVVVNEIYLNHAQELVITSGTEFRTKHSKTSLHYPGNAVDLRTSYFTRDEILEVKKEIDERLLDDYDVVIESNHIHFEYQPKYRA